MEYKVEFLKSEHGHHTPVVVCNECGSIVFDIVVHDKFHAIYGIRPV